MAVTALYPYKYPSRSRRELYGDDILVHVGFRGNRLFAAASTHRVSPALRWDEFVSGTVVPWAAIDPLVDPSRIGEWTLDGAPLDAVRDATLDQLGVGHKSMLTFRV